MFKWTALSVGTLVLITLMLILNDLRRELKRTAQTVNEKLPQILEKTEKSTATLADLSDDIRQLRNLGGLVPGAADDPHRTTLAQYADSILDRLESVEGVIGTKPLLAGNDPKELKDPQPVKEWTAAARKEAMLLVFRAKSKEDLLTRLTQTRYGSDWYLHPAGDKPLKLSDWISRELPTTRSAADAPN